MKISALCTLDVSLTLAGIQTTLHLIC